MSEYEHAKQVIKQMRLKGTQRRELAEKAFAHELGVGRPDLALKAAREFGLSDDHVTRAAAELFTVLLRRRKYDKALLVARSYHLAEAGDKGRMVLARANGVRGDDWALGELHKLARSAALTRREAFEPDAAIEAIREAGRVRDADPRVRGRAVLLPDQGELWLTGDLHGSVENLRRFAALADLANHPRRILVLQEIVHARIITADSRDLSFVAIMEAIELQRRFPGQVYYLLGNHDLAVHLNRELIKGGKPLNRYLFRGMSYMYRDRYEDVLEAYRAFIANMPAALIAPNGVFMAHSTPKRPFISSLSRRFLTETSAERPLRKLRPVAALVNGRDYAAETAEEFADRLECDVMLCGHTPTSHGVNRPNDRHLILDSQHHKARYIAFDLATRYTSSEQLAECVDQLLPARAEEEVTSGLV